MKRPYREECSMQEWNISQNRKPLREMFIIQSLVRGGSPLKQALPLLRGYHLNEGKDNLQVSSDLPAITQT